MHNSKMSSLSPFVASVDFCGPKLASCVLGLASSERKPKRRAEVIFNSKHHVRLISVSEVQAIPTPRLQEVVVEVEGGEGQVLL